MPEIVDDVSSFLSFLCYGDHSAAQMCVLRGGLQKLGLADSLHPAFLDAVRRGVDAVECVAEVIDKNLAGWCNGLDGDVFCWPSGSSTRQTIKHGTMRKRLERCLEQTRNGAVAYIAELSHDNKSPHCLTGEKCRALTTRDMRDSVGGRLPMWDRGHCFVGGEGVGSCLHVDQAWWSNIAKNFLGYKLVALWGPDEAEVALAKCEGQLMRRPLSQEQCEVLCLASRVALMQPGDIVSFTGGLPHVAMVVGDGLNVTAYESFVNFHPRSAELLLRGAARTPERGVMPLRALHGLLDDVVDAVRLAETYGDSSNIFPIQAAPPACGMCPAELLAQFRKVLLRRARCARRMLGSSCVQDSSSEDSSSSSDSEAAAKVKVADDGSRAAQCCTTPAMDHEDESAARPCKRQRPSEIS